VIVFVGDWIRLGEQWFQVTDIYSDMEVIISDGRKIIADEQHIDELLSDQEYYRKSKNI
jgi:hypothetical protein